MHPRFSPGAGVRVAAAGLAVMVLAVVGIIPVQAHAALVRSEPADNSVLTAAPAEIKIWFSEPVASDFSTAQVMDVNGQQLPLKGIHIDHSDPTLMVLEPPALGDGMYTVSWIAASAADAHVDRGVFVFRVGPGPLVAGAAGTPSGDSANPPISIPEAILRWLGYFGLLAAVGAAGMPQLVLRLPAGTAPASRDSGVAPASRDSGTGAGSLAAFFRQASRRIFILGALAAAFTFAVGLLYLAWQVSNLAGNGPGAPEGATLLRLNAGAALVKVLFATTWGYAWLARQAITAALGLVFLRLGRMEFPRRGWRWLALVLVAAALASQAVASHAAGGRSPAWPILVDWLHLVFAGLWVGGLFALAVGILPILRRGRLDFKQVGRAAWGRFGPLAAVSVGMLIATGLYSAGQQVISADALILTGYGQVLIAKAGLMLAVGLLGLLNSLSLHPGLVAPLARWLKKPPGWTPFGLRRLSARIVAEASLGVGVVLLAGILTTLPPASEPQYGVSPSSQPDQMIAQVNDLYIGLSIKPNRPGQNILNILAASTHWPAPAQVLRVIVRMTYLEQDMGTISRDAVLNGPDTYRLPGDGLAQSGRWKIDVVVRRKGLPDSLASFNWIVMPLGDLQPPLLSRSPWKEALSILAGLMAALVAVVLGVTYIKPKRSPLQGRIVQDHPSQLKREIRIAARKQLWPLKRRQLK